jgi:hypothetical protein
VAPGHTGPRGTIAACQRVACKTWIRKEAEEESSRLMRVNRGVDLGPAATLIYPALSTLLMCIHKQQADPQ